MRSSKNFSVPEDFKSKLFHWAQQFEEVIWLDSNNHHQKYSNYDAVLAVEAFTAIKTDASDAFEKLKEYQEQTQDWIFGYLSYDLKNDTEKLCSKNFDELHFPDLYFFQPKKLFLLKEKEVEIQYLRMVDNEIELDFSEIKNFEVQPEQVKKNEFQVLPRISKTSYLQKIEQVLARIQIGDIYEANFCQEFYAENAEINPNQVFLDLNAISSAPFSAFLKLENYHALCASPERYIKKIVDKAISQPIKGTARRSANAEEDLQIAKSLQTDEKERAENIMIVDLVRNDLSKTASRGSVEVEELCSLYSFPQVHQLISTIVSKVEKNIPAVEILRTTFPMGSMTGAPKVSAMKIMEDLEETKRGLYSGSIGYFKPPLENDTSDFDFNVVIRSILYNSANKYLSFSVGGAITTKSEPEKEYEECLLKAKAMKQVLKNSKE